MSAENGSVSRKRDTVAVAIGYAPMNCGHGAYRYGRKAWRA